MEKVWIVLRKEFQELSQQRSLVMGVVAPAVVFTIVPLSTVAGVVSARGGRPAGIGNLGIASLAGLTSPEAVQALVGMQVAVLFMIMPTLLTSIISAYSIIGEKTSRTLEPLLATPIRTWELLLGKGLVAVIPGVGLTWAAGAVYILGLHRVALSDRVFSTIVSPGWLVSFVVWTPLLSIVAVFALIIVSSRVNDARTAQQVSSAIVLPFLVFFLGQAAGWLTLGVTVALVVVVVLLILAALLLWAATRLFQREVILTRWK